QTRGCEKSLCHCTKIERRRTEAIGKRRQQALNTEAADERGWTQIISESIRVHLRLKIFSLEIKLQAKLNLSRISYRESLTKLANRGEVRDVVECRIRRQSIRDRLEDVRENRLVEDVVELGTELKLVTLTEIEVLRQIEIRKELAREAERRPR